MYEGEMTPNKRKAMELILSELTPIATKLGTMQVYQICFNICETIKALYGKNIETRPALAERR